MIFSKIKYLKYLFIRVIWIRPRPAKYIDTIFSKFRFVERVIFYDAEISNHKIPDGIRVKNFSMGPKSVYQFGRDIPKDSIVLYKNESP
jgi:two-component system phosphate regulon sensor histidine kinase PhoR